MGEELNDKLKVKDEEPEPKRPRLLETQHLTEDIWEPPYWDKLHDHIIVQVYSYLENVDRLAMAQVCQAWYRSFKDPSLWRSWEFNLGDPNGRNMISFLSMFGSCLQDVVICCERPTSNTSTFIKETLENLMDTLENARLCRLKLIDLKFDEFDDYPNLKTTLSRSLIKLLKSQTALKHVVFRNCEFYHGSGTEVLKVLQDSSGRTLESLKLRNFFLTFARVFEAHLFKFELLSSDVEKFTNLKEISLHYINVTEQMLQQLAISLKGKLEHMTLDVRDYEKPKYVIPSATWRYLTEACPQLKVHLSIAHFLTGRDLDIIQLLVPGMPLAGFLMMSRMKREEELKLASILVRLADKFDKHLESIKLLMPYLQDSVDNEIIGIVDRCCKLTSMSIGLPTKVAFRVASVLRNAFQDKQVQSVKLVKESYKDFTCTKAYQDVVITFREATARTDQ